MTLKQQALAEALGLIAAEVTLKDRQVVRIAAVLDRLYIQAQEHRGKAMSCSDSGFDWSDLFDQARTGSEAGEA